MTTTSFPVVDDNIDHTQWRDIFAGPTGYTDGTNEGLDLSLSSTSDTATVAVGKYRFKGFTIRVTAPHGLTLAPATSSPLTYSIGIVYDPSKEADPAGPLSLAAPLKSGIAAATPSGGDFLTLYEVTRQPSQVLSQAAWSSNQQWALGPIFRSSEPLPDPLGFNYGQILVQGNPEGTGLLDVLVRRGSGGAGTQYWQSLNTPSWKNLTLASGITATGGTRGQYGLGGGKVHLAGLMARSNGANFVAGTEYTITTLTQALWPHQPRRFYVDSGFGGGGMGGRIFVSGTGVVTFRAPADTDVASLDGVSWHPKGL